jgi:phage terminase large subunit-like protein
MSPTDETRLDDGRGNHRRGSSSWLPRDEAPKQSVSTSSVTLRKKLIVIAFLPWKSLNSVTHFINQKTIEKSVAICRA